jgi:ABC-type protease/lipase transport system fused ATPase/permease subunit
MADEEITIGSILKGTSEDRSPEEELATLRERLKSMKESANRSFRQEQERREALEKRVKILEKISDLFLQIGILALGGYGITVLKDYWTEGNLSGAMGVIFCGIVLFATVRDAYRR